MQQSSMETDFCWINVLKRHFQWRAGNIRSEWSDQEAVTFLALKKKKIIFPSCFPSFELLRWKKCNFGTSHENKRELLSLRFWLRSELEDSEWLKSSALADVNTGSRYQIMTSGSWLVGSYHQTIARISFVIIPRNRRDQTQRSTQLRVNV